MHKRQRATGRDYFYPEDKCALWWGPNGTPASALIPLQVWVTARMDKSLSPLKVIGSRREKFGKKNQKLLAERAITIVFEKKNSIMGFHILNQIFTHSTKLWAPNVSQALGRLLKEIVNIKVPVLENVWSRTDSWWKEVWNFCLWGFEGRHSYIWASLVAQMVKNPSAMWET